MNITLRSAPLVTPPVRIDLTPEEVDELLRAYPEGTGLSISSTVRHLLAALRELQAGGWK